jgi:hypothetical protein
MNRFAALALTSLFALGLAACGEETPEDAAATATAKAEQPDTPAEVVDASADALQQGDLLTVLKLTVPPAEFERIKQEWEASKAEEQPTEEEKANFAEMMAKLTAPDAEQQLMAEFEPHLAKYDAEMAAQMPLMIGMGRGFAVQAIQENPDFSEQQKAQATQTIDAVAKWLGETNFSDRARAEQAVEAAVEAARAFEVKTLDELRALQFEQMLQKAGIAFTGTKNVLKVYGLDLDQTFDSVSSEVVNEQGDNATVKVNYQLFGQPLSFQTEMMRVDGRWYGKDTVEQLRKELDDVEHAADDAAADAPAAAEGEVVEEQPAEAPAEG